MVSGARGPLGCCRLPASLRGILVLEPMVPFTLSLMEQGYSGSNVPFFYNSSATSATTMSTEATLHSHARTAQIAWDRARSPA